VTESPPLNVDQPNGYTECEDALNGTREWKYRAEKADALDGNKMKQTATHIIRCFECRVTGKSKTIEREYRGSKKIQVELAYTLRKMDQKNLMYLEAHGFDAVQPIKRTLAFENYESYFKCHSVNNKQKKTRVLFGSCRLP